MRTDRRRKDHTNLHKIRIIDKVQDERKRRLKLYVHILCSDNYQQTLFVNQEKNEKIIWYSRDIA